MRRKSYAQPATSFSVEDTLLLASSALAASASGTAPATPQRRWEASPSTPRNWPIMTSSASNTPSSRHRHIRQWDSTPRRGVVGAGGPAAGEKHGGEPGRRQSWGERKQTEAEEERHGGGVSGFSGRVPGEGAAARGYVRAKKEQPLGAGVRRAGGGRGRANAPLTGSSPRSGVVLRRSWEERKSSTRDEEEEEEEGKRRSSREKDDGVARPRGVAGFGVRVSTAGEPPPPPPYGGSPPSTPLSAKPPGCDWDSSVPAAGGLDGRRSSATRAEEEDRWPQDFLEKSPPSEPGSHKTCSTQWSEMESQSQGSGNSYAGSTTSSSAMSAHPAGRRSVHAWSTTTSPRPHAPTIAEAKRPLPASSSPSLAVVVSTGGPRSRPEPCKPREEVSGGDTPNLPTPGALTPGALRARSESAPMIWD
ncbi:unnamed protein product [Ectocarpus sp. 13 AM-2016]